MKYRGKENKINKWNLCDVCVFLNVVCTVHWSQTFKRQRKNINFGKEMKLKSK